MERPQGFADTSMFIRNFGGEFIILLIYVDDILVTSNNTGALPKTLKGAQSVVCYERLGPTTLLSWY